jgi:hypothetical protein
MATPRTGKPRKIRSDSYEGKVAKAQSDARARSQADVMLDYALGGEKLLAKGRKVALEMLASLSSPSASDLRLIILLAQATDDHTRLLRQVPKPKQAVVHACIQLQRALVRDIGGRSKDRSPFTVGYEVPVAALQSGGKAAAAGNVVEVDWVAKARSMGLRD